MKKELEFAKTLEEIKKLAKEQQNVVSKEQVREYFAAIGITEEQLEPVYQYLNTKNIGIGEPVAIEERLTSEEKNYLSEYLDSLGKIRPLSESEKRAWLMSAMNGDEEAKEKILNHFLPQVPDLAKLYTGQGVLLEDLIGEGNLALAMGMEMLGCLEDPGEADGLLGKMMMDAMEEYIKENSEAKKRDLALADQVNHVQELAKELAESLHKKITVEELSEETGMEKEKIREAIRLSGNRIEYFEEKE